MVVKLTMLINGKTQAGASNLPLGYSGVSHTFGASETVYQNTALSDQVMDDAITGLVYARLAFLPQGAEMVAIRGQDLTSGEVQLISGTIVGNTGYTLNNANDAILCQTRVNAVAFQRRFWLHFSPDERTIRGEIVFTQAFANQIQNYFNKLQAKYGWMAKVKANVIAILNITNTGLVQFKGNNPFADGAIVTIQKSYDPIGKRFYGGPFVCNAVGGHGTQGQLVGWPPVATVRGTAFTVTRQFTSFAGPQVLKIVRSGTKKVGRPFELYRGRAVRRR